MKYDTDTQLSLNLSPQSEPTANLQVNKLSVTDAELILYPGYFPAEESDFIFQSLLTEVSWRQDTALQECYEVHI